MALTAGQEGPSVLVDLDPLGPGPGRILGIEAEGLGWEGLTSTRGRLGSRAFRQALPLSGATGLLTWTAARPEPPPPPVVREVLSAARRGHRWAVLDLPRTSLPADVLAVCDEVVLVVPAAVGPVTAASRLVDRIRGGCRSLGVVVRCRRGSSLGRDVAGALSLPLVAELPDQARLEEHFDLGLGPVHARRSPLAGAARAVLARVPAT